MSFSFSRLIKASLLLLTGAVLFTACNKHDVDPIPIQPAAPTGTQTIAQLLDAPAFSLLKEAATKAGVLQSLGDATAVYTVFAPDNDAFQRSGVSSAVIQALPVEQLRAILQHHIVPGQRITASMIPTTFANLQLPSTLVLQPAGPIPTGLRMSVFPSRRDAGAWVNNVPILATDAQASNGVVHRVAALVMPAAAQMLWNRINTDPNLTYLRAAILRADQATPSPNLVAALSNGGANLTVFAPSDAAFRGVLTLQITGALMGMGVPQATAQAQATALASTPDVFTNPQLAGVLTSTVVQGLVVYHLLGTRAFSVNLPPTATTVRTLLNNAVPTHPGVTVQATFGPGGVTAATVKGAANPTASNIAINPTPAPGGTSDQNYINGILHVIDQVLLPQ